MTDAATRPDGDAIARYNSKILLMGQALAGACPPIVFGVAGYASLYLLPKEQAWLATLPVSIFMLGNMLTAFPASLFMGRYGRRAGFALGGLIGILGAVLATLGILKGFFWLFCLGCGLLGIQMGFGGFMRFAATDGASDAIKPKLISTVLVGGVIAATVGPWTAIALRDLFDPIPFAGAFLGVGILALGGILATFFLKDANLAPVTLRSGRPMREIAGDMRFVVAVACGAVGYVMMNFIMTSAPLAMKMCGLSFEDGQLGLQWHVIAMYLPSFVTGSLIARYGATKITAMGFLLLIGCALVDLSGLTRWHFWSGLVLLGIGWNFSYIGATALVSSLHRSDERAKVQATNDFIVFGLVTVASLLSGAALYWAGWAFVNMVMLAASVVALILLLLTRDAAAKAQKS
jgi:MFS family permease